MKGQDEEKLWASLLTHQSTEGWEIEANTFLFNVFVGFYILLVVLIWGHFCLISLSMICMRGWRAPSADCTPD